MEGVPLTNTFRDIIDIKYRGGLSLSRIYMEGFGFSIREYQCRNCGASYHLKENDWVVLELKR